LSRLCQPTCPFFRCGNHSMVFRGPRPPRREEREEQLWAKTPSSGQAQAPAPLCSIDYSPCQGAKCSYALCERRALLPSGVCSLEERMASKPRFSIEEEAAKMERSMKALEEKLRRKRLLEEL